MSDINTCTSSTVKILPLTEVLQIMHKDVMNFKEQLRDDSSEETVHQIMDAIGNYTVDDRLPENITTFITEMVTSDNNYSPANLSSELDMLAEGLNEAIHAQQHRDNVAFVRTILKVLVKHADEVTRWLEEEVQ